MSYGQLQYPPDRLLVQVYRYQDNQPPFVPQIPVPDPELGNMLPNICSALANMAGELSQNNNARTYHYNQLSMNGFNNQDFANLVAMTVDYIYASVVNRRMFRNFWEAIPSTADFILRISCAYTAVNVNDLMRMLPPDIGNDTRQAANQWQTTMNECMQVRQQTQQRGAANYGAAQVYNNGSGGYGHGGHQGGGMQQGHHQSPQGHVYHQPRHVGGGQAAASHSNHHGAGAVLFGGPQAKEAQRVDAAQNSKYDYLSGTPRSRNNSAPAASAPNPQYQPPVELVWAPSPVQWYIPLATGLEAYYLDTQVDKGTTYTVFRIKSIQGENEMDRKAHALVSKAGLAYARNVPTEMFKTREQALSTSLAQITDAAKLSADLPTDQAAEAIGRMTRFYGQQSVVNQRNLDSAIFTTRYLHKKELGLQTTATAFRYDMGVTKQFVSLANYQERLEKLREQRTFAAVAASMQVILANVAEDQELKDLIMRLDTYLTQEINDVFKNKMSLPDFRISSFIDDARDIFKALLDTQGDAVAQPLADFQGQFIDTFLFFAEPETYEVTEVETGDTVELGPIDSATDPNVVTDVVEKPAKSADPTIHNVETLVSITCVEMLAVELNLTMPPNGMPAAVGSDTPALEAFIRATIDSAEQIATNPERIIAQDAYYFAHHYLVTADDVVFEVHKGLIGSNFYLISRR